MQIYKKPLILCILDGWGYSSHQEGNAIALAHLPNWNHWWRSCPRTFLEASGPYVGLPEGQMGNSEVGHMSIGAGRTILQDLPRIHKVIQQHELEKNPTLLNFIKNLKKTKGVCHLMGLLSPGGVHSHVDHMLALIKILDHYEIPVKVHAWLDGRDTPPISALGYMQSFMRTFQSYPQAQIVTLGGRYWAMDRDNRWERTELAYQAMRQGQGRCFRDPLQVISQAYAQGITDEFIEPAVKEGYRGMSPEDGILIANFRADRVRQITAAFVDPSFAHFERENERVAQVVGMTHYSDDLASHMDILFPLISVLETLGEVIASHGKRQLRLAETEKYAHVTFFFNGGQETLFQKEDRILIPSEKVKTYDLSPAMSAYEITHNLIQEIQKDIYDVIIVNYANADMVGHTGNLLATIKAVEVIDECLGDLSKVVLEVGGTLIITADHGNAEAIIDPLTHETQTAHTCNLVPFLMIGKETQAACLKPKGSLIDIAPTILELLNIPIPKVMEGQTLIETSR